MNHHMKRLALVALLFISLAACSQTNTATTTLPTGTNDPDATLAPARKVTVQERQRTNVGMNLTFPIRVLSWEDQNTVVASVPGRGVVRWAIASPTLADVYSEKGREAVGVVVPGHLIVRTYTKNHTQQTIADQRLLWLKDGATSPEQRWDAEIMAEDADHPQSIAYDPSTGILVPTKAGLMVLNMATGGTSTITTTGEPQYIAVSASGDIAYTTRDGQVCIVQQSCQGTPGAVITLQWEPSGRQLLITSVQASMIWDATPGDAPQYRVGRSGVASWHPSLPLIASVDEADNQVVLWASNSGKEIQRISYNNRPIQALAWSPDGTHLVATGHGGTFVVWDVTASQE